MGRISDILRQYQVVAFYLLVFGISWPAMILMFYVFPGNTGMQGLLGLAATFSPALVALWISALAKRGSKQERRVSRWVVFTVAWICSWAILVLHTWQVRGVPLGAQIIGPTGLAAILPGWLISCALSRLPGARRLFETLLRPRGHWGWYLVAVLVVPAIQAVGAGITYLAGGEVSVGLNGMSLPRIIAFAGLIFVQGFLVSGGVNEETGWRGFVLPRLQARFPIIVAIAIVWFFWALWHIPYDIGTGTPPEGILLNRIVFNFIWTVLMVWIYNRTKGSLLAPALFHPAMNTFGEILPRTDAATAIFMILASVVIIHERMWKRLPTDSPAVFS